MTINVTIKKAMGGHFAQGELATVKSVQELADLIIGKSWVSFAVFQTNYRSTNNFIDTTVIALDIDDGKPTLSEIQTRLKPYKHFIYTTKSHQKRKGDKLPADRYRVVLFLEQPISNKVQYKSLIAQANLHLTDGFADKQCNDVARMFYCPNLASELISIQNHGNYYKPMITALPAATAQKAVIASKLQIYEEFMAGTVQEWNNAGFNAAVYLRDTGKSIEQVKEELFKSPLVDKQGYTKRALEASIHSAFSRPSAAFSSTNHNAALNEKIMKSMVLYEYINLRKFRVFNYDERFMTEPIESAYVPANFTKEQREEIKKREVYVRELYDPKAPKLFLDMIQKENRFNTYIPPKWLEENYWQGISVTIQYIIPVRIDHFLDHLCGNYPESKEYLLDWLANCLQSRNITMLVIIAAQGIGKGVLASLLKSLVGASNFETVQSDTLRGRFNAEMSNKVVVNLDEFRISDKDEFNRLKSLINETIQIEGKGVNRNSLKNHANFYITSNDPDAIKLQGDDRRFSVIDVTEVNLATVWASSQIDDLIADKYNEIAAFGQYLYHRKITRNMALPFKSSNAYQTLQEDSLKDWQRWMISDYLPGREGQTIAVVTVQQALEQKFPKLPHYEFSQSALKQLARQRPTLLKFKQITGSGKRVIEVLGRREDDFNEI